MPNRSPHTGGGWFPGPCHSGGGWIPGAAALQGGASLFGDGFYSQNVVQSGSILQPLTAMTVGVDFVPAMSAATTGGFTASDSGHYSSNEAYQAFDNNFAPSYNGCFLTGTTGVWIKMALPQPMILGAYTLQGHNEPARFPNTWVIEGSSNGNFAGEQEVVDTRSGITTDGTTLQSFTPVVFKPFKYYRIYITANNGDGSYTRISQMELKTGFPIGTLRITGAATVVPNAASLGDTLLCDQLVVDGGSLALSAVGNGFGVLAKTSIMTLNAGRIKVDDLGLGGFVTADAWTLAQPALRCRIATMHHAFAQQQNVIANDGGMLFLAAPIVAVASGCIVSADGTSGNRNGGRIGIIYSDTYANNGTVRANGNGSGVAGVVSTNKV